MIYKLLNNYENVDIMRAIGQRIAKFPRKKKSTLLIFF